MGVQDEGLPCDDYRALNARTIPDRYSPMHIEDFAQRLHGERIFSKINFIRAYHQMPIVHEDMEKTAIMVSRKNKEKFYKEEENFIFTSFIHL